MAKRYEALQQYLLNECGPLISSSDIASCLKVSQKTANRIIVGLIPISSGRGTKYLFNEVAEAVCKYNFFREELKNNEQGKEKRQQRRQDHQNLNPCYRSNPTHASGGIKEGENDGKTA